MSDPNDPRENHLKRKFEELPDQVTIADRPRNKRRGGLSSINIAHPSSAPPTLITPSSVIPAADIAMPVTNDQVEAPGEGMVEHSQQVLGISTDSLSSHLPTSPPIAPILNVPLVSVGTEMTIANDQVDGSFLQHSSILTDPPSSELPTSLPIYSVLNAEMMPAESLSKFQADIINNFSAQNVNAAPNYGIINQGVDPNIQITLEMIRDKQLVKEVYKWLSPPKESVNYNAAYAILKSQPNTCLWFLNGNTFSRWLNQPGFLWVKGKSGSGKTILSNNSQSSSKIQFCYCIFLF
ncbi:hypothetical protein K443DRAFT_486062 [Laccaria amethystina LaAM-08-1]|uniref:Nephrocystin 3-like N-terminal domain-containing protein n=1 Tax=Laccaria amethystina LaAM-08-1 TaxID=1095629 RepID=A0A0C9WHM2_9AGAR|nr:hypothetical protein K443DRAFT_486062 [Laccaria amethystina LaAM-08-1]